jgi:hypothetical protein
MELYPFREFCDMVRQAGLVAPTATDSTVRARLQKLGVRPTGLGCSPNGKPGWIGWYSADKLSEMLDATIRHNPEMVIQAERLAAFTICNPYRR